MSEPTFTRKVYICSRQASLTSRSTSDFDITLSRNLVLPQKCASFVTDIQIPHSWYCVDVGQRYLYFRIVAPSLSINAVDRVEVPTGNYTGEELANELRSLMAAKISALGLTGQRFYVLYEPSLNNLRYSLAPQAIFGNVDYSARRQVLCHCWHRGGYL